MSEGPVLQLNDITVRYKDAIALGDVSLQIQAGEIHAILGENGAGKTTLLRVLAGLLKSGTCSGEVRVAGAPVVLSSPADAVDQGVGVVAKRPGLFPGLTVADNIVVSVWQKERGFIVNRQRVRDQAQRALELVGLKLDPDAKATSLSPIQQRLLMIARVCVRPARVIVLDEPATALSTAAELGQLFAVVRGLSAHGIATLYMSRRPTEVLQIADRISVLRDGYIVATQTRSAFDETELVREMISQRIGDGSYVDYDDLNETRSNWFDGLRNLFTGNRG
jgi:ABC-type sugar transport system ATPase subunit